jgi:hypothetical protein
MFHVSRKKHVDNVWVAVVVNVRKHHWAEMREQELAGLKSPVSISYMPTTET